jgi:hypothetical protein
MLAVFKEITTGLSLASFETEERERIVRDLVQEAIDSYYRN